MDGGDRRRRGGARGGGKERAAPDATNASHNNTKNKNSRLDDFGHGGDDNRGITPTGDESENNDADTERGSYARRQRKRQQVREQIGIDMDDDDDEEEGGESGAGASLANLGEGDSQSDPASSKHHSTEFIDHGYKLEPFNVRRELKEKVFEGLTDTGRTTGSRNTRKRRRRDSQGSEDEDNDSAGDASSEDSADDDDPWFQSVREQGERAYTMSTQPTQNGAPFTRDRAVPTSASTAAASAVGGAPLNRAEALTQLAALLLDDETPLQAIKRLKAEQGGAKRRKIIDNSGNTNSLSATSSTVSPFEQVIELADVLISSGSDVNVYSETKEQLEARAVKVGGGKSRVSDPAAIRDSSFWEYVWDTSNSSCQVYGPFSTAQMREWFAAGHFSSLPSSAFRRIGSDRWTAFTDSSNPFVQ